MVGKENGLDEEAKMPCRFYFLLLSYMQSGNPACHVKKNKQNGEHRPSGFYNLGHILFIFLSLFLTAWKKRTGGWSHNHRPWQLALFLAFSLGSLDTTKSRSYPFWDTFTCGPTSPLTCSVYSAPMIKQSVRLHRCSTRLPNLPTMWVLYCSSTPAPFLKFEGTSSLPWDDIDVVTKMLLITIIFYDCSGEGVGEIVLFQSMTRHL